MTEETLRIKYRTERMKALMTVAQRYRQTWGERCWQALLGSYDFLDQHANLLVCGFSLLYFAGMLRLALQWPLWLDEIATYYVARQPNFSAVWRVLERGTDIQPPLFHAVVHALAVFGKPWLLRLPALVGMWCMAICLYIFISRELSRVHGLIAMLVPFVTGAAGYAVEARPYGIVLGGAAAAMVCWQRAIAGQRRGVALAWLWVACTIVVAMHYYGFLILAPFAVAEAARWLERRKIDWALWAVLAATLFPLLLGLPIINAVRDRHIMFWSKVQIPGSLLGVYEFLLRRSVMPLVGMLLVALACMGLFPNEQRKELAGPVGRRSAPAIALVAGFVSLPFFGLVLGILLAAFTERYVLAAALGFSAGCAYILERNKALAVLCLCVLLPQTCGFLLLRIVKGTHPPKSVPQVALDFPGNLPIVFQGPHEFVERHFYASPAVADRMFYVASRKIARERAGTDSLEDMLLGIAEISNSHVEEYETFISRHPHFLVMQIADAFPWLLSQLVADGANIVLRATGEGSMYEVAIRK